MKRKNKAAPAAEEMEFTFIPEEPVEKTAPAEEVIPACPADDLPMEITDDSGETYAADDGAADAEETPAEEPLPDPQPTDKKKKEKGILGICLPLIVICIGVSLMLAGVNALTKDTIAAQAAAEKERAVMAIFPDATAAHLYETTQDGEVYLALREKELVGCCISLTSGGFAGDISMMVGRTAAGEICGVQIVSMSESPGIGTKTKSADFLSQFRGKDTFVIGENLDAIAGATVSSRAVTAGVNRALEMPLDFSAIAAAYGLTLSANNDTAPAPVIPPAETEAPETEPAEETTAPAEETGDIEEETESTSSILAMPSVTPAASVNRVVLVSTTLVTEVETEAVETEEVIPETEETSAETEETTAPETSAETEDTAEPEEPSETTGPAETEEPSETTGPAETEIPEESENPAETDVTTDTEADTSTETEPVETAETESDSDTAAA